MEKIERGTEKMALKNLDMRHTTNRNNIRNKPNILFRFKRPNLKNPTIICYLPALKNQAGISFEFQIIVRLSKDKYLKWEAYVWDVKNQCIHENTRGIKYHKKGTNRMDAIKTLWGVGVVHNHHSVRNLNLLELCKPHIIALGRYNQTPLDSLEMDEKPAIAIIYQWLNGVIK